MNLPLLLCVAVVAGLLIGSFLTVVVERVPAGGSIMAPPSRCGACEHRLGFLDLVPIVSWVVLRGRCRYCGAPIGVESILIELATAAVFVAFALEFEDDIVLPAFWVFGATLVAQSAIDIELHRLPRSITYTGIVLGGIGLVVAALVREEPERIGMAALGAAIAAAIIGAIYAASNARYGKGNAFGFGDVILSPLLGMFLGWLNPGIVPVGLFYGFILGAIAGVAAAAIGRANLQTALPFGPFLALGATLAVFWGQPFVDVVLQR